MAVNERRKMRSSQAEPFMISSRYTQTRGSEAGVWVPADHDARARSQLAGAQTLEAFGESVKPKQVIQHSAMG
jgi:hypothetical protein